MDTERSKKPQAKKPNKASATMGKRAAPAKTQAKAGAKAFAPAFSVTPSPQIPTYKNPVVTTGTVSRGLRPQWVEQALTPMVKLHGVQDMQSVFDQLEPNSPSKKQLELRAKFAKSIMQGTKWLTSSEVDGLSGEESVNKHINANRWEKRHKVFGVPHRGKTLYPMYLFDINGSPIREVEQILAILGDEPPMTLAAWFESRTALLDGMRPREVIGQHPKKVLEAAKQYMSDDIHG